MKLLMTLCMLLLVWTTASAQSLILTTTALPAVHAELPANPSIGKIKLANTQKWRLDGNHRLTGGLMLLAGAAKGFNETLQFNWKGFSAVFPKANPQWFWPGYSFKNKYKDGDPSKGARFPLSTSLLVMCTDQYHLNNFIQRAAITTAIVLKIGKGKRPFKQYVFDALYYTGCYQLGFAAMYYPFKARN